MACRDDRCDDSTSFDKDLTRSHNDAMVRRLLALALSAIFVLLSTSAWAQCTGWDSTRAGRHACCAHAGHETTEQGAAACCAGVEQSRHGTVAAHAFHMPPLVALAHVAPVPALASPKIGVAIWAFASELGSCALAEFLPYFNNFTAAFTISSTGQSRPIPS